MDRRTRAFREFATLSRDRESPFPDRVRAGLALGCEALDLEYGSLTRVADGGHTLLAVVADETTGAAAGDYQPLSETFCELPVGRGELVAFGSVDEAPPGIADRGVHEDEGFTAYIGGPVTVDDEVYGTCCFAGRESREPFVDWERELVATLAAWISGGLTRRARALALDAERDRLDGFAAMVDHDVREPLSGARGHAELASEAAADGDVEDAERHAAETVAALARTDRLVEDLLRLSGDAERAADVVPADLRSVAEHAWGDAVGGAGREATLLAAAGVRVPADESLLKRLLAELFRFCLATGPDGLRVRVGPLDDRTGFFVADDGPGFPGESDERPPDGEEGLEGIERIAAAHDWTITAGLSAEGGVRVEVETGEGLWPAPVAESGPTVGLGVDAAGPVEDIRGEREGGEEGSEDD